VIIFGSVRFLSKKLTKLKFFLKKTETGSNRPVSVRFGFLGQKPIQTGLVRFVSGLARFSRFWLGLFPIWLGFLYFGLGFFRFWLSLARFFFNLARFFSVSVRFGFLLIKPKPDQPVFLKF
jgi:hypothetical protein